MKKLIAPALIAVVISLVFWPVVFSQIYGIFTVYLPGKCDVDIFSKRAQPFLTVVVACPRRDMMRIWPLPVVDPWFEDWWEGRLKESVMIERKIS